MFSIIRTKSLWAILMIVGVSVDHLIRRLGKTVKCFWGIFIKSEIGLRYLRRRDARCYWWRERKRGGGGQQWWNNMIDQKRRIFHSYFHLTCDTNHKEKFCNEFQRWKRGLEPHPGKQPYHRLWTYASIDNRTSSLGSMAIMGNMPFRRIWKGLKKK